jgi:hypothetical protein
MSGDSKCDVVFDISKNLITNDQQDWDSLNIPFKMFCRKWFGDIISNFYDFS